MVIVCKYCNKEYSSYASCSNHIKNYHTTQLTQNTTKHHKTPKY